MAGRASDWSDAVSRLRDVLARLALRCRESGDLVEQALQIVDDSERAWKRMGYRGVEGKARGRSRGDAVTEYRVEPGAEGDVLVELRSTGAQPFRCPETIYSATIEVLAQAGGALSFEEIRKRAARELKRSGEKPPIYLFRIVLRFWKIKGVVRHAGRKFVPPGAGDALRDAATRAWKETKREPLRLDRARVAAGQRE